MEAEQNLAADSDLADSHMRLGREARNLLGMEAKQNLAVDSDLAGSVSMGNCACAINF